MNYIFQDLQPSLSKGHLYNNLKPSTKYNVTLLKLSINIYDGYYAAA